MAAILVDYENVNGTDGLKGTKYLTSKDTLYIFYSNSCCKIRAEYMEEIEESECEFRVCKLLQPSKNGLDFYIATKCGMLNQQGESQIVIISNDKGYRAVVDFFEVEQGMKTAVVCASSIEKGLQLLNAQEDIARRREIAKKSKLLELASEQARLEERKKYSNK